MKVLEEDIASDSLHENINFDGMAGQSEERPNSEVKG
jgi:hypothetical protein